jgi:hypothetical protein
LPIPGRALKVDISDCTLFNVTHIGKGILDPTPEIAEELLERALAAISEVAIWTKTKDQAGKNSAFLRQFGRADVKLFLIEVSNDVLLAWMNPLFMHNPKTLSVLSGFLGNMVVTNGPSTNPVPPLVRRVMGSLDLINLGFYTESFVNLFSLVDDVTQEVIKAGMARKGLSPDDQKGMLRAIKEERFRIFLTNLAKLCDWKSLEDEDSELYARLLKANSLRNNIMHGSTRLTRDQTIDSAETMLQVIEWLRCNPFQYSIPRLPLLCLVEAEFGCVEMQQGEPGEQSEGPPADEESTTPAESNMHPTNALDGV